MNPDQFGGKRRTAQLRYAAEARFGDAPLPEAPPQPVEELLHELQVHQIELEMQNEALRQAQSALEESRDRYVELYEFAPVGYLTLSDVGVIAGINLTGAGMLGEDRKNLLNRRFARYIGPDDQDRWHREILRSLRTGEKQTCELCLKPKNGMVFDARVDCLRTNGDAGKPAIRITLTDITARNQAAVAELRLREDRLRLAKTAAGLGVYDHDIVTGKGDWDPRIRELWGIAPNEPVGYLTFMEGIHPDDRAPAQASLEDALEPGGRGEYYAEYRVINRANGELSHVAVNGQVFFDGGRAVRSVGMVRDISAQKRLEKALQERRSEMEALVNQQVAAQTAAAIAHELNQPLISISAYSEAALRMFREGAKNPEKLARALEGATEQAQRAGRTLLELLDFLHRGDAGVVPVALNEVVRDALAIAGESGYGRFRSVVELAPDLPPVRANRLQVQKVLVNLLHNADEAMCVAGVTGAEVAITVRTVAEKNLVQVTVQDSGPGFDKDMAERVFTPFYTTKAHGVGLGLAISRAIIEAHGGRLWADSGGAPGATFHFTLPFAS